MRRTGICLVVPICALLASCGGGEDLPAMRNRGATPTTLPSRGAPASVTTSTTTMPPASSSTTTVIPEATTTTSTTSTSTTVPGMAGTTSTTRTTSTVPEEVPTVQVATAASHVVLLEAFRDPAEGESWWLFPNPGPFDGPRVLLAADVTNPDWVQVTSRIVVELGKRRVTVYDGSEVLVIAEATIGAPETPTPTGTFDVNQVQMEVDPGTERGAGLFGTSAFSEVLDIIDGGEPAVALHGTNQPELLGEAVSRGCIRVADQVIELLINLALPLGTPVEILA